MDRIDIEIILNENKQGPIGYMSISSQQSLLIRDKVFRRQVLHLRIAYVIGRYRGREILQGRNQ